MYTSHFGLLEAPFSITPDPQYLYMSERHREALAHLLYGIGEGGGFVVLTGEVGTGKTTICRCLLKQLPPDVDVAVVLNPKLTAVELLATLCDELRLPYPPDTTSIKVFVDTLYRHVLDAHELGRRTVLIIDEAQNLSTEALEQVRLLTNLETTKQKLLQVILIGQPELATALDRPDLRQLAQRVTARYHLHSLSPRETNAYITHRLEVAGRRETIFRPSAIREVHRLSGGVPRLINVICDRALLGAYTLDEQTIDGPTVQQAAREVLGHPLRRILLRRVAISTAAVTMLGAAVVGVLVGTGAHDIGRRLHFGAQQAGDPAIQSAAALTAPEASGSMPLAATDPTAPRLREVLADRSIQADLASAFTSLYARWRLDGARTAGQPGCDSARQQGFACLFRTGTWNRVRRFDLPAILELGGPTNDKSYATLVGLTAETATLIIGGRELTYSLGEIEAAWDGPFIMLWKPPALSARVIEPGARGRDVQWLRQRLDELEGKATEVPNRNIYDEELQERVKAFQRSRALRPDAIVGEETLAHLSITQRDGRPSLTATTP
jgi:general secretion pathway protein A